MRRGGRLIAVSVDSPTTNRRVVAANRLPFPILSDESRAVVRQLGLLHAKGAPDGSDVAIPAQFLIDRTGRVVWEHVAQRIVDRPEPGAVLREVRSKL